MRAAADTNVWTRAFLNPLGLAGRVVTAFLNGQFEAVISEPLLEELADVLARPKVARKHKQAPETIAAFLASLRSGSELVTLSSTIQVCRDPDDDYLIETAERGQVDVLVSEDQDLHTTEVSEYLAGVGVRVVTVGEFLLELEHSP